MGIPIGPDTSFILAEMILSVVDAALALAIPNIRGLRWIDEYELAFSERSEAEDAFAQLQNALLEYELRLNPRKTSISDLPIEFEPHWVHELRAFPFRRTALGQANDLIRFFDYMTSFVAQFPNDHIVKYAIARIRRLRVLRSNQQLYQSLLCQAMTSEPGSIRECLQALHYAENSHGLGIDRDLLELTINKIIENFAPLGHDYEISWCLWAALTWRLQISVAATNAISGMENSAVAILALDADVEGLFQAPLNTGRWEARMNGDELYEEEWLLAYEANVQGWLAGAVDHVAADPGFGFLKRHGVHFYTRRNVPIVAGALMYP